MGARLGQSFLCFIWFHVLGALCFFSFRSQKNNVRIVFFVRAFSNFAIADGLACKRGGAYVGFRFVLVVVVVGC